MDDYLSTKLVSMGIDTRHPAALTIDAMGLPITSRNVSRSGLQLSCPSMNYRLLQERFEQGRIELAIELPGGEKVRAHARRIYASSYEDEYLIGVQLSALNEADEQAYTAYLEGLAVKAR